ncbi:hypothetical protein HBH47_166260 [Parastagonospora nodorum]|nr:hypothetical protein HBH47_166260 [Parastagonospora nodorum]
MTLPFNQESWIWYTCAICMIAARIISRKIHLGSIRRLQYDDWIMGLFVTTAITALIVCSNRYVRAQSNLLPPGFDVGSLTAHDLERRRYGSKLVMVVEQTQIAVIWACKATLLIMYNRLTRTALHNENLAIKLLSAYVALGFVVMEILYFTAWCRPVSQYWAVPEPTSSQCNALINHRITKAVFNLSSDIIMLVIALQMLIRSLLPMKRKVILCGIFSLGIFVIIASMLNSYYSFKNPYKQTWIFWYVRESSTAILVANLPYTWTILRELFDLENFDENSPPAWTFHSARTAKGRRTTQSLSRSTNQGTANRSAALSKGSHGTQAMTLVDSMSPLRQYGRSRGDSLQDIAIDFNFKDEAIHPHDFATITSPPVDLEHGFTHGASRRPQSRITEDGTGGFYFNDRPISTPSRAYFATRSRESSLASTDRRPTSPTPSFTSLDSVGIIHHRRGSGAGVAGTGRCARDRRARAGLST